MDTLKMHIIDLHSLICVKPLKTIIFSFALILFISSATIEAKQNQTSANKLGTEESPLIVKTIPFSLGTDKLPIVIKIEPVNGGSTSPIYVELTRSEVDKELEKQKVENDTKLVEYTK